MKKYCCNNCGYNSKKYTNFCPNCGEKLNNEIDNNEYSYSDKQHSYKNSNENKVHVNIYWLIANIIIWPSVGAVFFFLISTGFFDRITMFITNTY